ncbi:zinc finger protein 576, tandem duplicate 1 isoform X2 [Leuresthes tenuis]|uniref:zinc finger protein 576, tandem duplicate 1 isoform X2 n=1 Tax=Leuresthes tenuis TaxID=355514 RepID=UPI003B51349B
MQNQTQAHTEPNPATTSTSEQLNTAAEPALSQPDAHDKESRSTAPTETETIIAPETPASMAVTASAESESGVQPQAECCENTGEMDWDLAAKPSVPTESVPDANAKPGCDGQKAKKQEKGDGRKYVPSKKAMVDPLKMDMSKQLVMPLTSSQLSLQCIECHIIFSDHKSKERHLKLSHPAEYEQCILRNALFACYVCDRHFTNSIELMAHQKAHIEKKPFKCPICSQAFKKSSELTMHKKIHFGEDGYACADCGKPCKTLTLLKYHQRTHTGERPYVCKECGKRFTMSKALQKHTLSHLPDGAEGDGGGNAAHLKKNDGASTTKYPCSVCKATFKSSRTRLHHMKTKHNGPQPAASHALPAEQQVKEGTPIITPISISQPALLQLELNGPLQRVDANIDTEQIRRLIESLGNVQKVNQVVILGQVPPHAPPLEVQQVSQLANPMNFNLSPPQIDFIGLKQSESKTAELDPLNNSCDPMEQTIILEPITPDGQLENPSFSELGSHIAAGENIELTIVEAEQTERPDGEVMHQILQQSEISAVHCDPMVCHSETDNLKENLEQTVILELTPALIPTMELEKSQTEPQNEMPSSSSVLNTDQATPDQVADQTVVDEREANLSVPPLMSTVELELTSLHPEEQDLSSCPLVPPDALTHAPGDSDNNSKEDVVSLMKTVGPDQAPELDEKTQALAEQDISEKLLIDGKNNLSEVENQPAKEEALSQLQTKEVPQNSELPINVMSAQELVKVRKRKPARTFIFQGYMQDLVGSIYKDDFQINAKPAKRQRTKKAHLVVKFGPQNKEKKNKKQKKPTQMQDRKTSPKKLSEKNVPSQNKGGKGKKDRTGRGVVSGAERKSPSSEVPRVQQVKEDKGKNKIKKQKVAKAGMTHVSEHTTVGSPMFKKKKQTKILRKDQPRSPKDGKTKKNLAREDMAKKANSPGSHITEDALLLLKGHKQPQLKVYKLDPSTASGQTPEASPHESQTMSSPNTSESADNLTAEGMKKGGRAKKSQKALSLLSSLQISHQERETLPTKPKTSRKRKASLRVETEGVITSKRALQCKDCGEKFGEVSSLQKHKTTAHIVESPSLTYTNGNIFEGVSRSDLYQLPKVLDKVVGVMNAATDWDTEPEMVEMALEEREQSVSFPALIPSPSLPVPPQDVEMSAYKDMGGSKTMPYDESHKPTEVHSPSIEMKSSETRADVTQQSPLPVTTQTKSSETGEPLASDEDKREEDATKNPSSESEVQATTDEDVKEDLLLEVDLVTVGELNDKDDPVSHADAVSQNESDGSGHSASGSTDKPPERVNVETTEKSLTSQTVSCSTHQVEVKEEEEELFVQKRKEGGKGVLMRSATRGRRRGTGCLKSDATSKTNSIGESLRGTEPENEQDECQLVYEKHSLSSEIPDPESGTRTPASPDFEAIKEPVASLPSIPSTLEERHEEPVVFELQSLTTSVEEVMKDGGLREGKENDREADQSPGIILERFLTSRQRATADKETCLMTAGNNQRQGLDRIADDEVQCLGGQEIKVEENTSDPLLVTPACQSRQSASVQPQHHRDIRTILVKEESSQAAQGSKHMRWNVEPVGNENAGTPLMETEETTRDCRVSPESNTSQCIFYPVKEEEREVLLGAPQNNRRSSTSDGSDDANQTGHQTAGHDACEGRHSPPDYQETVVRGLLSEPGAADFADVQAMSDSEWQHPSDLQDFVLQSSDEEDTSPFELSEPQLDTEAEILAYFSKNQSSSAQQPDRTSPNLQPSTSQRQAPRDENRTREPIDYFSKYFGWDTWVEIATCTNKHSDESNPVTSREVARFVGIHIAMGTLKFPSPRLYWEDLTKVPLIAEAVPLSRFLELSRTLKLTSPSKDPASSHLNSQHEVKTCPPENQGVISQRSDRQCQFARKKSSKTQTDPLWKVQPLLCRFNTGCQSLRRQGDYAVDQHLLPLTGKTHDNKPSLLCTSLIGFDGLLSHVDLKLDLSDKEDAVEKMVPKGSMVFLCKQELSTPAMLERLLVAGVHGAGRVGGARGQIGDEFVSSDGKLMLRRSHCGFILSTAGNSQRNIGSLIDSFEKAQTSARLNRDLQNLYSIPLTASAPTCWPQAVLWYLTDVALVNSWLLYRSDHASVSAPLTLMAFRLEVSKALILSSGSDTQDSVPPQPPSEKACVTRETPNPVLAEESPLPDAAVRYDGSGHWPEQLAEGEGGRCRFGDCQRTSRVLCLKCCVFLCISRNHNCFLNFHNQGSLGKE